MSWNHSNVSSMQNEAFSKVISIESLENTGVLCKKTFLKKLANFTGKHLRWSLLLVKLSKRNSNIDVFSEKFAEFSKHLVWITSMSYCFWYFKRSYWNPPQEFCILIHVYIRFKYFSLGSISQYGNKSWITHFHYIWLN